MNKKQNAIILILLLIALVPACIKSHRNHLTPEKDYSAQPAIDIIHPAKLNGWPVTISGQVRGIEAQKCKVVIVRNSGDGWQILPSLKTPFTLVDDEGKWSCSSGDPGENVRISVYLLPDDYSMSQVMEITNLPGDLHPFAIASTEVMLSNNDIFRVIDFSDRLWRVKECMSNCGPGPNRFSAGSQSVWVDGIGQLHLRIRQTDDFWTSSEVVLMENLGYGEYQFHIDAVNYLDNHAVLGLFTWDDEREQNHREIDIELSRWGYPDNQNTQYVVQPFRTAENMLRFDVDFSSPRAYVFNWKPDSILFYMMNENGEINNRWHYSGPDIPEPGNENTRINLWLYEGQDPAQETEIIITKFIYKPVETE